MRIIQEMSASAGLPFSINTILTETFPRSPTTSASESTDKLPDSHTVSGHEPFLDVNLKSNFDTSVDSDIAESTQQNIWHTNTEYNGPQCRSREHEMHFRRIGHSYQSRAPAKRKKPRTSFSKKQISLLENRFLNQKYLASSERASLAYELNMSDAQVKTWFQNRRTKWRRQEAECREYEHKTNARMITYSQCFFPTPNMII